MWLNSSATLWRETMNPCSGGKWDRATQTSLYGLKLHVSNELSNRLKQSLVLSYRYSLWTPLPSTWLMTFTARDTAWGHVRLMGVTPWTSATHDALIWRDFQPQAHPSFNHFLCCPRAGKQQRHAGRTRITFPGVTVRVTTFVCSPRWLPELHPALTPAPASGAASS